MNNFFSNIMDQRLVRHGITHVINSTKDVPTFNVPGIQTTRINVDDHPYARLDAHFDRVADAIHHKTTQFAKNKNNNKKQNVKAKS
jgi:hypothetical protein